MKRVSQPQSAQPGPHAPRDATADKTAPADKPTARANKAIRAFVVVAATVYVLGVVVAHFSFSAGDRAACQRAGGLAGRIWCPDYVDTERFSVHFAKALAWPARVVQPTAKPARNFEKTVVPVKRSDAAVIMPTSVAAPRHAVSEVQQMLRTLGYITGDIDGIAGARTRAAIREFQLRDGMQVTGEVSDELVARLTDAVQGGRTKLPRN